MLGESTQRGTTFLLAAILNSLKSLFWNSEFHFVSLKRITRERVLIVYQIELCYESQTGVIDMMF